jgi:hypothetical protein
LAKYGDDLITEILHAILVFVSKLVFLSGVAHMESYRVGHYYCIFQGNELFLHDDILSFLALLSGYSSVPF